MNTRILLLRDSYLFTAYPGLYILHLEGVFNNGSSQEEVGRAITGYRLRVWLSWVIMIIVAIYKKWTTGSNNFFKIIYVLMVLAFGIEGIYMQRMVNMYDIATNFQDSYSYGVIVTLINIVIVAALTAFLQVGVWWFTRKWHRQ
jgi:hypothetical protein